MGKATFGLMVVGCAVAATGLAVTPSQAAPAAAAAKKAEKVPVVKMTSSASKVTVSRASVGAGTVEFRVGSTSRGDYVSIIRSSKIKEALAQVPKFDGDDPAAVAQAVTNLNNWSTIYGGAPKGTRWQVALPQGKYYAVSLNAAFAGSPLKTKLVVKNSQRTTKLHSTTASVTAVQPNVWKTKKLDKLGSGWMRFTNNTRELHFADFAGVKRSTTKSMIQASLQSPPDEDGPAFYNGEAFGFDVISPGITVAVKAPHKSGKYMLACWVASESDGMPHALMGMWKLVTVD